MIWAEIFRRCRQSAILGIAAVVTACATPPRTSLVAVPCDRAHADFSVATAFYASPGALADATDAAPAGAASLNVDAQAADAALTELTSAFASLAACRASMSDAAKARAELADDVSRARAALAEAGVIEAAERHRLDHLMAGASALTEQPPIAFPVPAARDRAFVATSAGEIYDRPDSASAQIAPLRQGQRVTAPSDPAAGTGSPDWQAINLNDGSVGYVLSTRLRPAPVGVEMSVASKSGNLAGLEATVLIIRQTLPQKRATFAAMLSEAAEVETNAVAASPQSRAAN